MRCRRGYDVFAFAAAGAALSVGLDICPDAIAAANKQREEQLAGHPNAAKVGDYWIAFVMLSVVCRCFLFVNFQHMLQPTCSKSSSWLDT
jgi:hypothetical protein